MATKREGGALMGGRRDRPWMGAGGSLPNGNRWELAKEAPVCRGTRGEAGDRPEPSVSTGQGDHPRKVEKVVDWCLLQER